MQNQATGTTEDFAKQFLVKSQSVLKRHCETGSYFGIIPTKLPNGRLMWPLDQSAKGRREIV